MAWCLLLGLCSRRWSSLSLYEGALASLLPGSVSHRCGTRRTHHPGARPPAPLCSPHHLCCPHRLCPAPQAPTAAARAGGGGRPPGHSHAGRHLAQRALVPATKAPTAVSRVPRDKGRVGVWTRPGSPPLVKEGGGRQGVCCLPCSTVQHSAPARRRCSTTSQPTVSPGVDGVARRTEVVLAHRPVHPSPRLAGSLDASVLRQLRRHIESQRCEQTTHHTELRLRDSLCMRCVRGRAGISGGVGDWRWAISADGVGVGAPTPNSRHRPREVLKVSCDNCAI